MTAQDQARLDERRAEYLARKSRRAEVRAELAERRRHGLVLRHAQKLRNLTAAPVRTRGHPEAGPGNAERVAPVTAKTDRDLTGGRADMSTTSQPQDSPVGWVNDHIRRYVDSGGTDGYDWRGTTILLLTTIGRRSGTAHRTALIYRQVGDEYVVVASKGGAPNHPAWYLNLADNPDVRVQVKDEEFAGRARDADEAERAKLWPLMTEVWPDYDNYQKKTERQIPVVVISRA